MAFVSNLDLPGGINVTGAYTIISQYSHDRANGVVKLTTATWLNASRRAAHKAAVEEIKSLLAERDALLAEAKADKTVETAKRAQADAKAAAAQLAAVQMRANDPIGTGLLVGEITIGQDKVASVLDENGNVSLALLYVHLAALPGFPVVESVP